MHFSIDFSLPAIKFHRRALQWTMKRTRHCQLISHKNKLLRVEWCLLGLSDRDRCKDVIFVDESNIELSSAGRLSFYQMGSLLERIPSRAAQPKHSYTVSTCYFRPTHNVVKFKASIHTVPMLLFSSGLIDLVI